MKHYSLSDSTPKLIRRWGMYFPDILSVAYKSHNISGILAPSRAFPPKISFENIMARQYSSSLDEIETSRLSKDKDVWLGHSLLAGRIIVMNDVKPLTVDLKGNKVFVVFAQKYQILESNICEQRSIDYSRKNGGLLQKKLVDSPIEIKLFVPRENIVHPNFNKFKWSFFCNSSLNVYSVLTRWIFSSRCLLMSLKGLTFFTAIFLACHVGTLWIHLLIFNVSARDGVVSRGHLAATANDANQN